MRDKSNDQLLVRTALGAPYAAIFRNRQIVREYYNLTRSTAFRLEMLSHRNDIKVTTVINRQSVTIFYNRCKEE